jgi:cytochrome c biogenesis protein CcmG/thiol:disulfide interchange protein DsbE
MRVAKVAAIGFVGLIVAAKVAPTASPQPYHPVGEPLELPGERLAPVGGVEFDGILVGLRGAPVVVNVWASWCAPCRTEMPLLERAARRFDGRVAFVGVASRDDRDEALRFLDDIGVTYPNVFDSSGDVRSRLGLRGFPTTYVFDASGTLVRSIVGGVSEQQLAAQLEELTP